MDEATPRGSPETEGTRLTQDITQAIDALYPSPQKRADAVWERIAPLDLNVFDLFCFCLRFAFSCATGIGDESMVQHIIEANRRLNEIHYSNPTSLYNPNETGASE